jgi:hypothetical protein
MAFTVLPSRDGVHWFVTAASELLSWHRDFKRGTAWQGRFVPRYVGSRENCEWIAGCLNARADPAAGVN